MQAISDDNLFDGIMTGRRTAMCNIPADPAAWGVNGVGNNMTITFANGHDSYGINMRVLG